MDTDPVKSPNKFPIKIVITILLAAIIILVGAIGFLVFGRKDAVDNSDDASAASESQIISGTLDINGVVPQGASVAISQKAVGSNSLAVDFISGLTPHDGDRWNFNEAIAGQSYEIQARLIISGDQVVFSSPIYTTAPASNEVLTLNVESEEASEQQDAVISGNIVVNGYIPEGATISVKGRSLGVQEFTDVAQNLPGQPRQFMSYTTAVGGRTYEVVGTLYDSNGVTIIGTSPTLTVTAPAVNETLIINSTAHAPVAIVTATPLPPSTIQSTPIPTQPPVPVVISGSINFNGVAPPNSRIVIFQKIYNASNYQVAVDNITPVNGATWRWANPTSSTWYDIIAILKQRQSDGTDKDIATSAVQSVAAPATSVQFTLNSGFSLNPPGGSIGVSCGSQSGSTWNAQITFDSVSGAQSYWYQIGTTNGGIEVDNSTQNASGDSNLVTSVQMNSGVTYYARYAYANIPNLSAGSSQFSPFSSTKQLRCGS